MDNVIVLTVLVALALGCEAWLRWPSSVDEPGQPVKRRF
jgi:hypothetical protein